MATASETMKITPAQWCSSETLREQKGRDEKDDQRDREHQADEILSVHVELP